MLRAFFIPAVASLVARVAHAQDLTQLIGSLSGSCQAAAGGLMTSDFGTCANVMALVPVIGAAGSVLPPLSDYVKTSCPTAPCSNSTVEAASATIQKGCAEDLTKGVTTAVALSMIVANYAPVRQMLCSQYVSNSSFCATTLLSNVEKSTGKNITFPVLETILVGGFAALAPMLAPLPKDQYCDGCGHALYTEVSAILPVGHSASNHTSSASANSLVSAVCGASFLDGQIPPSVRQAPSSNSTSASGNTTSVAGTSAAGSAPVNAGAELKPSHLVSLTLFIIAYLTVAA